MLNHLRACSEAALTVSEAMCSWQGHPSVTGKEHGHRTHTQRQEVMLYTEGQPTTSLQRTVSLVAAFTGHE